MVNAPKLIIIYQDWYICHESSQKPLRSGIRQVRLVHCAGIKGFAPSMLLKDFRDRYPFLLMTDRYPPFSLH